MEPATFAHGRPPAHVQLADGSDAPVTVNGLGGGQTEQVLADFLWPQEKRLFFGTLNFKNYFWIFAVFVGFFELINIFILDFLIIYFGIFKMSLQFLPFWTFFCEICGFMGNSSLSPTRHQRAVRRPRWPCTARWARVRPFRGRLAPCTGFGFAPPGKRRCSGLVEIISLTFYLKSLVYSICFGRINLF